MWVKLFVLIFQSKQQIVYSISKKYHRFVKKFQFNFNMNQVCFTIPFEWIIIFYLYDNS